MLFSTDDTFSWIRWNTMSLCELLKGNNLVFSIRHFHMACMMISCVLFASDIISCKSRKLWQLTTKLLNSLSNNIRVVIWGWVSTDLVLRTKCCRRTRSMLSLHWPTWSLSVLPKPWYWPCRIKRSLSSMSWEGIQVCHLSGENGTKRKYILMYLWIALTSIEVGDIRAWETIVMNYRQYVVGNLCRELYISAVVMWILSVIPLFWTKHGRAAKSHEISSAILHCNCVTQVSWLCKFLTTICPTASSCQHQMKHQISESLSIREGNPPVHSLHKN